MKKLTASDIVKEIAQLDLNRTYEYVSRRTTMKIIDVEKPEGPIGFVRWDSRKSQASSKPGTITKQQLAKVALVCSNRPNYPIHFDRLFSAGGNSRSALETLLIQTPNFFVCRPERIDTYTGETIKNLKHVMWCPDERHDWSVVSEKEYNEIITEFELGVDFGNIGITQGMLSEHLKTIDAKRTHTQMQVALVEIGQALNFHTWIAKNDRSIPVKNTTLGKLEGVIESLDDVPIFHDQQIKQAAELIDCIWFTNDGKRVPAIIEVEHSTGVTSGLTRMLKFRETIPSLSTSFAIVAPNNLRNKVVSEANQAIFRELLIRYMPYSTISELYGLIQRYSLSNVVDHKFIYPFMEKVVES